jgi:hypothetical protein
MLSACQAKKFKKKYLSFWQFSRPGCHFGRPGTPSKEEARKAGLEHYPTKEGTTNISSAFSIKVPNLTIKSLSSNKMLAPLKLRIIPTITTLTIQATNIVFTKSLNINNPCHEALWNIGHGLKILEVIDLSNPSVGETITNPTVNMKPRESTNSSSHTSKNRTKKNRVVHKNPFVVYPKLNKTSLPHLSALVKQHLQQNLESNPR